MDVRVLGCSGTYPSAHVPASGFLISGTESRVWLDCGTGTFAALQGVVDFVTVDALMISHLHSDHCLDIFPFYYALRLHPSKPQRFPVYAPPGTRDHLVALIAGDNKAIFSEVFDFHEVDGGDTIEVGEIRMEFVRTEHPLPTLACSIRTDGHRLVYSADSGPGGELATLANDADSFICEATYQNGHGGPPLHLSASEAGELARRSGVGALFLTHLFPTLDHRRSQEEAAEAWQQTPVVLEPGMVLRAEHSGIELV